MPIAYWPLAIGSELTVLIVDCSMCRSLDMYYAWTTILEIYSFDTTKKKKKKINFAIDLFCLLLPWSFNCDISFNFVLIKNNR